MDIIERAFGIDPDTVYGFLVGGLVIMNIIIWRKHQALMREYLDYLRKEAEEKDN